jgi:hypothetical protein
LIQKAQGIAIVIANSVIALRSLFLRCGDRAGQGATHQVGRPWATVVVGLWLDG